MNWFVLALLAGIAANFFSIFNRSSLKDKGDSTVYAWWFEFFRFIVFFGIFLFHPVFPTFPTAPLAYLWLLLLGLVEVLSVYFFMRSHQLTELSLSLFVIKLQLIWVPILAFILIGERLTMSDYGGIGIILLGIFIAIYSKDVKRDKGIVITFISSLFISLLAILMKKVTEASSTPLIMMSMSLPAVLILPLLMKRAKGRILSISKIHIKKSILGASSNIISMFLSVSAIRLGSTSKVSAVYQSMMVIALFYSIVILREKKQLWQKIIGMIIVISGLFLLSL